MTYFKQQREELEKKIEKEKDNNKERYTFRELLLWKLSQLNKDEDAVRKATLKCTGCGETPTLCDKCNQEICANGQEEVAEQARKEMIEEVTEDMQKIENNESDYEDMWDLLKRWLQEITKEEKGK